MNKKASPKSLTTDYLDEKLDKFASKYYLNEKLDKNTKEIIKITNENLDKRTEEIIVTFKSLMEVQNEKIDKILDVVNATRKDMAMHNVRLNDHDARIEKLEQKVN